MEEKEVADKAARKVARAAAKVAEGAAKAAKEAAKAAKEAARQPSMVAAPPVRALPQVVPPRRCSVCGCWWGARAQEACRGRRERGRRGASVHQAPAPGSRVGNR